MCQEMLMFLKMTGPFWTSLPPCQIEMLINSGRYLSCSAFAPDMSKKCRAMTVFRKILGKNVRSASFAGQTDKIVGKLLFKRRLVTIFVKMCGYLLNTCFLTRNGRVQNESSKKSPICEKYFLILEQKKIDILLCKLREKLVNFLQENVAVLLSRVH